MYHLFYSVSMYIQHHPIVYPFFRQFGHLLLHCCFHSVTFSGPAADSRRPLLVISNHISWWDGCWNFYLSEFILHRRFYFMAGTPQLRRHPFMKAIGGIPLQTHSRNNLKSIAYASRLLQNSRNAVLLYPQGKIASAYKSRFRFSPGTDHLLHLLPSDTQLLLIAYFTENGTRIRPGVWGYYTLRDNNGQRPVSELYQTFYDYYLNIHIQNISE